MGIVSMGWVPRIPEIKEAIGLTNTELGLVFIGSTLGAVTGAQLAGRLIHTFATRRVISCAIVVMPLGLVGKTAWGCPAAAHTTSYSLSASSIKVI